jgi:hypothetical protein
MAAHLEAALRSATRTLSGHGRYTAEAIANRRLLSQLIRMARDTLLELD